MMILISSCMVIVLLALASGLDINPGAIAGQAIPLAVVCAAALTFLLINPFDLRS